MAKAFSSSSELPKPKSTVYNHHHNGSLAVVAPYSNMISPLPPKLPPFRRWRYEINKHGCELRCTWQIGGGLGEYGSQILGAERSGG